MSEVKRWWLYERIDNLLTSVAPFENRRERMEQDGKEFFKPKFSEMFEGPSREIEVMPVAEHYIKMQECADRAWVNAERYSQICDNYIEAKTLLRERNEELAAARKEIAEFKARISKGVWATGDGAGPHVQWEIESHNGDHQGLIIDVRPYYGYDDEEE